MITKKKLDSIKGQAKKAFTNGYYQQAFQLLWDVTTVNQFFTYASNEKNANWFVNKEACILLWDSFLCNNERFTKLVSSKSVEKNLYFYFSNDFIISEQFEINLSNDYPAVYLQAIQVNQLFYKKERLDFLLDKVFLQPKYDNHKKAWKFFYDKELYCWNKIQEQFNLIKEHNIETILYGLTIVLESKRQEAFTVLDQQNLGATYSFFVELLFSTKEIELLNNSRDFFQGNFLEYISKPKQALHETIDKAISFIIERKSLIDVHIDPYSFEKGTEIKIENNELSITYNDKINTKWHQDGLRYSISEQLYFNQGEEEVNMLISHGLQIPGKNESDIRDNRDMVNKRLAINSVLSDLGINEFYYNKLTLVKAGNIISPIQTLASNVLVRYERGLKKISTNSNSWLINYFLYLKDNPTNYQLPFFYINEEEYREMNNKADNNFIKEHTTSILKLFSEELYNNTFNRFETEYNVFSQPFFRLGSYLFCPSFCLIPFTGIYIYIDALLKNNGDKTAKNVEGILKNNLTSSQWEIKLIDDNESGKIKGDPDLIISDEKTVLLIQLKRTNLRLNPKEVYLENTMVNSKASQQLNDAEIYLKNENPIFDLKKRKIKKWIVSTSFEGTNEVFDDCLKVSYFELIHTFKMMKKECVSFSTLDDFISFFEKDSFFKSLIKEERW